MAELQELFWFCALYSGIVIFSLWITVNEKNSYEVVPSETLKSFVQESPLG